MLEKRYYAVPPQAFVADGTNDGVITIGTDAAALFKVGMIVLLNATGKPVLTLQVKQIDPAADPAVNDTGNIQVGPISGTGPNTGISARTDISAYTVARGANISANSQRRPDIDWAEAMRAVYDEEPTVALRTVAVDESGDRYTHENPQPVNIFPATDIAFSLGALTLPILLKNLVSTLTFDEVTSDTVGNQETLTFYLLGSPITTAVISKTSDGWVLNIGSPDEDLLLLEDGDFFLLEDGSGAILLET